MKIQTIKHYEIKTPDVPFTRHTFREAQEVAEKYEEATITAAFA